MGAKPIIYQQKYDKCNKQQTVAIASGVSIVIGYLNLTSKK